MFELLFMVLASCLLCLRSCNHMKYIEHILETLIFNSRWLLAPFYLGLVLGIGMLLVKFGQELMHILPNIFSSSESEVVLAILALVDLSLVANLLIIVIFSGYENFVSKINTAGHEDRPEWMGKVDFSGLKIKVIASIVARYQVSRDFLHARLNALPGVVAPKPKGAMYLFFAVDGATDTLALCQRLVAQAGLGLAPGSAFGPEGEGYVRWCFASSVERLGDGVQRLEKFLRVG